MRNIIVICKGREPIFIIKFLILEIYVIVSGQATYNLVNSYIFYETLFTI